MILAPVPIHGASIMLGPTMTSRRWRRGNYSMIYGIMLPIFIGFTALSVDTSWQRISQSQAQDVADAAAYAALVQLRQTGDANLAEEAAKTVVGRNRVGALPGELGDIEFGSWERGDVFKPTGQRPNAVRTTAGRYSDGGVKLQFAKIWGKDSVQVEGSAVAASRSLHVVLIMDITGSFASEIHNARDAALTFLDVLEDLHGKYDMIGMAVFTYRFSNEWTPMFSLSDTVDRKAARLQWETLNVASKTTTGDCKIRGDGKYPQMPREYCDEPGTDHHVGIIMARQMLLEQSDPFAYRATILLTDGQPNGLKSSSQRNDVGYVEERWREYAGPTPHSSDAIKKTTVDEAVISWEDHRIHQWTVTFRDQNAFLKLAAQGDGKYFYTTNASDLVPIFEEIAESLPLLIVE